MNIKYDDIKVGDTIYKVKENVNTLRRERIEFTDAEGNTWYRFNMPPKSYEVKPYNILGKSHVVFEGEHYDMDRNCTLITDQDTLWLDETGLGERYFFNETEADEECDRLNVAVLKNT